MSEISNLRGLSVLVTFLLHLFGASIAQELQPVSLCSTSPLAANRSGIITYSPTSGDCSLILNGLENVNYISLLGVSSRKAEVPSDCEGKAALQINDSDGYYCAGSITSAVAVINIPGSSLKLEVANHVNREVQINYYRTFQCGDDIQFYPSEVGGLSAVFTSHYRGSLSTTGCNSTIRGLPPDQTVRFSQISFYKTNADLTMTAAGTELSTTDNLATNISVSTTGEVKVAVKLQPTSVSGVPEFSFYYRVEVLECGEPPEMQTNSTLPEIPWVTGVEIEYGCEPGYEVKEDNSKKVCEVSPDGSGLRWSENSITCVPVRCNDLPPVIKHGKITGDENRTHEFGYRVHYTCDTEYILVHFSHQYAECQSDGTWSTPPSCVLREWIIIISAVCSVIVFIIVLLVVIIIIIFCCYPRHRIRIILAAICCCCCCRQRCKKMCRLERYMEVNMDDLGQG